MFISHADPDVFIHSRLFSRFLISACSFRRCALDEHKKQNNFVFNDATLLVHFVVVRLLPLPSHQHTMKNAETKNVSHSNDNRHSKLLFIHGLGKGIRKNLDDCQLLVCFQLHVMISTRSHSPAPSREVDDAFKSNNSSREQRPER